VVTASFLAIIVFVFAVFSLAVSFFFSTHLLFYTAIFLICLDAVFFAWTVMSVMGVSVERKHSPFAVVGQPLRVVLKLINNSRVPKFALLAYDVFPTLARDKAVRETYFLSLPRGVQVSSEYTGTPARRGQYRIGPLYLIGGDPFGFFRRVVKTGVYSDLLVLPSPYKIRPLPIVSVSEMRKEESETIAKRGESGEFLGVQEYAQGDSPKHIHWVTTARLGKLISRQFELNVASALGILLLDGPQMTAGGDPDDNPMEYAVKLIASLGFTAMSRLYDCRFLYLSADSNVAVSGTGAEFYRELSVALAKVGGDGHPDLDAKSKIVLASLPENSNLVVFCADVGRDVADFLQHLRLRHRSLFAVTFNLESFRARRHYSGKQPRNGVVKNFRTYQLFYQDDLKKEVEKISARAAGG
jgi:uncharacterized protein (DUF58 family)